MSIFVPGYLLNPNCTGSWMYLEWGAVPWNLLSTGEKAIGTGWTVAPPEEEESNWGGTILSM